MARTISYELQLPYMKYTGEDSVAFWLPEVEATFSTDILTRRGLALIDSGSLLSAIPRASAALFGIDPEACATRRVRTARGTADIPKAQIYIELFGLRRSCDVLLIDSESYLVGRDPFFSLFRFGFDEYVDGSRNRLLVGSPDDEPHAAKARL